MTKRSSWFAGMYEKEDEDDSWFAEEENESTN